MATDASEFMSVKDVATRLDVSETTVRRMVTDGQLDSIRVRCQIRITLDSFEKLTRQDVQVVQPRQN